MASSHQVAIPVARAQLYPRIAIGIDIGIDRDTGRGRGRGRGRGSYPTLICSHLSCIRVLARSQQRPAERSAR